MAQVANTPAVTAATNSTTAAAATSAGAASSSASGTSSSQTVPATFSSLAALQQADPQLWNQMMGNMASNICSEWQKDEDFRKQLEQQEEEAGE